MRACSTQFSRSMRPLKSSSWLTRSMSVRRPVGDLLVGGDAHRVELLLDQHADAADALQSPRAQPSAALVCAPCAAPPRARAPAHSGSRPSAPIAASRGPSARRACSVLGAWQPRARGSHRRAWWGAGAWRTGLAARAAVVARARRRCRRRGSGSAPARSSSRARCGRSRPAGRPSAPRRRATIARSASSGRRPARSSTFSISAVDAADALQVVARRRRGGPHRHGGDRGTRGGAAMRSAERGLPRRGAAKAARADTSGRVLRRPAGSAAGGAARRPSQPRRPPLRRRRSTARGASAAGGAAATGASPAARLRRASARRWQPRRAPRAWR